MNSIKQLSPNLVNKIAAGEVIERPASLCKELLENSIDAQATFIDIEVADGGKRLVRVTDDGAGIAAEDLPMAVAPHATSKLVGEDDLYAIQTMGFRGEALASIGAVSQLRVVSRRPDQPAGARIEVEGGRVGAVQAVGCPPGTTVEVRNLFFNTPARRKFLRTHTTEMGHITEHLSRIALAHPRVGFSLQHSGRTVKQLPTGQGRLDRIAAFFGPELVESLIHIDRDERGVRIAGWVGRPQQSRATARWQYVFVNGRYVRDRFLAHAIKEAYRSLIEPSRFPPVFLFVELDPSAIDVNVHPTKIEVRWRDSNLVHSQVLSTIREALRHTDMAPEVRAGSSPTGEPDDDQSSEGASRQANQQSRVRQAIADYFRRQAPAQRHMPFAPPEPGSPRDLPQPRRSDVPRPAARESTADSRDQQVPARPLTQDREADRPTPEPSEARSRPAVQLHNAYLVAETEDGIVIVDQHALHERVLYEQVRSRLAAGTLLSQRLLLPETVRATPEQISAVQENADLLDKLGIELTAFGPDTLAVQSFPGLLANLDVGEFTQDLLDRLTEHEGPPNSEELLQDVMQLMACKAAVKAGEPLKPEEVEALMAQRDLAERSSTCPHGRPTSLRLSMQDLQKQFKRT
ncbi:MAG TPA: DNA mismatch repair endonuclease MutL [Phycisphaerae bacterium]|nr:DNA mismatch repair endonuclease MutL [Phycisphaerae bacterium]